MDITEATVEELKAEINRRIEADNLATSEVAKVQVQSFIDSDAKLSTLGLVATADSVDPDWIGLQFPIGSASGFEKAFLMGVLGELIKNYKAQPTNDPTTIRVRKDRAIKHLEIIIPLIP